MAFVNVRPPERARSRLESKLKQPRLALAGLPTIISQTFYTAPSSLRDEVVVWVARSPQERDELLSLLRLWFHKDDNGNGNGPMMVTMSEESLRTPMMPRAFLALGEGRPVWLLATTADLRLPLPSPELLKKSVLNLTTGQAASPALMSQGLAQMGYEFNTMVTEPGTFARRGGIVDVWPHGMPNPTRLDILDQSIEKIATLNWKTQRNREELQHVSIPPCELPKAKESSVADYLEPLGAKVHVLMPDPVELETLDVHAHEALLRFEQFPTVIFQPFADTDAPFDLQAAPLFHRDFQKLGAFLSRHAGWTIWLCTARAYDLRERVESARRKQVVEITEADADMLRGFVSEKDKLALLTDWEIYGQEEDRSARRSERADIIFVAELRPGDFVVHVDHGIGRFVGTKEQEVDGTKREYFVLSYAEDDKLFVPVEMAEKLSKYIGVANPRLHRLSGGGWYQMTKKIKEEARATAEELLKLYAQRETLRITPFKPPSDEEKALADSFPYDVTPDQEKAISDVEHDLRQPEPMDRLICGDVGFGKTEVAIRAAFKAVANKRQVAILSPTTILTQQHLDTFRERLKGLNAHTDVLSRFRTPKQQEEALTKLKLGQTDIIIGTHRLLQPDVQFRNLGLVIIDEEQRFGVQHKERLKKLRLQAHVLTLTATPIPRTLNLALSGIRDITVIETPPEGRKPIETHIEAYHDSTVQRALERELERSGQVYFVYNHVETIEMRTNELRKLLPTARFAVAHGQMDEDELARVMAKFDAREIDVLVCSTIIENGLDLPNVNTLVVDHATHFGLAQLYQLRGRIGRGSNQAYAYFLYHTKKLTPEARKRLQALLEARELGSGFQLALRDLEIRGTGSILGQKQHGHVAAVGLTLYTRLLAETIRELREGVRAEPMREILIDLPLSIRIPKELEPNEQKRLSFYQKLALETTMTDLDERVKRLFRRKVLPEPVQNLVDVLKLKLLAQPIGVTNIAYRKPTSQGESGRLVVNFGESLIPAQIKALIEANGEWQFGENQIKIAASALGEKWVEGLQATLALLERTKHAGLDQKTLLEEASKDNGNDNKEKTTG